MLHSGDINRILVIGIGNEFKTDDSAGLIAARKISELDLLGVDVQECGGDCSRLLELWSSYISVIILDAVSSGSIPGTIHIIDAPCNAGVLDNLTFSTHALGLAEAVKLSQAINTLPLNITIIGIEGKNFDFGENVSAEIESAFPSLLSQVLQKISHYKTYKGDTKKWKNPAIQNSLR